MHAVGIERTQKKKRTPMQRNQKKLRGGDDRKVQYGVQDQIGVFLPH